MKKITALLIVLVLATLACGTQSTAPTNTPVDVSAMRTSIASDILTAQSQTETANAPTAAPVPTDTLIPTETPQPPTSTPQPETPNSPKDDGFYTVGVEIAVGKWESSGSGDSCYWKRIDDKQETINNHFGTAGGTVTIQASDYEVQFKGCGTWNYVEGVTRSLEANATEPKDDGFYTVGVEIAAGKWESTGSGASCYWQRIDDKQETIDNHFGDAGGTVTIQASDYEVQFKGCGTWNYAGE